MNTHNLLLLFFAFVKVSTETTEQNDTTNDIIVVLYNGPMKPKEIKQRLNETIDFKKLPPVALYLLDLQDSPTALTENCETPEISAEPEESTAINNKLPMENQTEENLIYDAPTTAGPNLNKDGIVVRSNLNWMKNTVDDIDATDFENSFGTDSSTYLSSTTEPANNQGIFDTSVPTDANLKYSYALEESNSPSPSAINTDKISQDYYTGDVNTRMLNDNSTILLPSATRNVDNTEKTVTVEAHSSEASIQTEVQSDATPRDNEALLKLDSSTIESITKDSSLGELYTSTLKNDETYTVASSNGEINNGSSSRENITTPESSSNKDTALSSAFEQIFEDADISTGLNLNDTNSTCKCLSLLTEILIADFLRHYYQDMRTAQDDYQ